MRKNKLLYLISEQYKLLVDEEERREEETHRQENADRELRQCFGIEEIFSAHAPENGNIWDGITTCVGMGPAYDSVRVRFVDDYELRISHNSHSIRGGFSDSDLIGYSVGSNRVSIHNAGGEGPKRREFTLFSESVKDTKELAERMTRAYNFIHAARKERIEMYRTVNPLVEVGLCIVSRLPEKV